MTMLRRFIRPLCTFGRRRCFVSSTSTSNSNVPYYATQTHLTGLRKNEHSIGDLIAIYEQTAELLKGLPVNFQYYQRSMEETVQERLAILRTPHVQREQIEVAIGEGILEEVIEQATEEVDLIKYMASLPPEEPAL